MKINNWEWPQFVVIALSLLSLGIHLARDGQQRQDDYNFASAFIAACIYFVVLYFGGFFK